MTFGPKKMLYKKDALMIPVNIDHNIHATHGERHKPPW